MTRAALSVFIVLAVAVISGYSYPGKTPSQSRPLETSSKHDLRFSPLCLSCNVAVSAMCTVLKWDKTEPVVLEFATIICKLVAKQSWVVCNGISSQFRDEFFYVFRQLADRSPEEICGLVLPDCADPEDPNQSGWTVALPPRPTTERAPKSKDLRDASARRRSQRPLQVLQLTDVHVDLEYEPGSEAECDLPICCRKSSGVATKPAGYWGTVGRCDVPYHTFEDMLKHINASHEIDYIMLSGDFINHADWSYSTDEHLEALRSVSSLVRYYFPRTPAYWAIGNHEGVPVNSFAPHFVDERFWPTWLYEEFSNMSSPWLNSDASETMLFRGSYSVKVAEGLRLISLNSGFCETTNFFLYLNQSDPDGTMSWLAAELFKAELAGESVHLLSHIPPGDGECLEGWARNYYRVVQRFSDTITAQFFGHVHFDYFTVFYQDMHNISSSPIGVIYAAPSVTTFAGLNPAYRIYEIDYTDQFKVVDIKNYFADLEKADNDRPPTWELLYSTKAEYGMKDLSPESWNSLIESIIESKKTSDQFLRNAFRVANPSCDNACRKDLLCSLRMGHHNSTLYCPSESLRHNFLSTNRVAL